MAVASSSTHVHRVRFVDYDPSPITSIAYTPLPLPSPDAAIANAQSNLQRSKGRPEFGTLVVGRQNGQVDIWEFVESGRAHGPFGGWILERILPPALSHPNISLLTLAIRDPSTFMAADMIRRVPHLSELRLFTAGSDSGEVVERCLFTGRILMTYPVPSAPVWALSVSPTHDLLCIASSSSNLHIVQLSSYTSEFELATPIHRTEALPGKTRTLHIAWGPPVRNQKEDKIWEWKNQYLITGNSDSCLRKWNLGTGRMVGRMGVGKVRKEKGQNTRSLVWAVAVLSDHTIISADSLGMVTFWDGRSQAQKQSFQAHAADALCLTIGPSGRTVYTSGPDQKVAEFTLVGDTSTGDSTENSSKSPSSKWIQSSSKRLHVHDVRALAIWPPYSLAPKSRGGQGLGFNADFAPILASGGLDMQVVLTPAASPAQLLSPRITTQNPIARGALRSFADSVQQGLGFTPLTSSQNLISISESKRMVLLRRSRSLALWKIGKVEDLDDVMNQGYEKLLEMKLEVRTGLVASALSRDGQWLAVSDLYETKLFRLIESESGEVIPRRIKSFTSSLITSLPQVPIEIRGSGSSSICFTPDSSRLVLGLSLSPWTVVIELPSSLESREIRVVKAWNLTKSLGGSGRAMKDLPRRGLTNGHSNGHSLLNGNKDSMAMEVDDIEGSPSSSAGGDIPSDLEDAEDAIDDDEEDQEDQEDDDKDESRAYMNRTRMMCVSEDGQWLGVGSNGGRVVVFGLDSLKLHCNLPTFASIPTSISFMTASLLLLSFPITNALQTYDIDSRRLIPDLFPERTCMSRQTESLAGLLPSPANTVTTGHASNGASGEQRRVVGWSAGWLVGLPVLTVKDSMKKEKKRERLEASSKSKRRATNEGESRDTADDDVVSSSSSSEEDDGVERGNLNVKFKNIIAVGSIMGGQAGKKELVVVQRPFMDLRGFPAAFTTAKYGT